MKTRITAIAAWLLSISAFGQGALVFNNYVSGVVDAKVTFNGGNGPAVTDGIPVLGWNWEAQLFGGPLGEPLVPLLPKTTFRSGAGAGYVVPVDVTVPNVPSGSLASIQMRVQGSNGLGLGTSRVFALTLGGGILPAVNLIGLEPFSVVYIPEPSAVALLVIGVSAMFFLRWRES